MTLIVGLRHRELREVSRNPHSPRARKLIRSTPELDFQTAEKRARNELAHRRMERERRAERLDGQSTEETIESLEDVAGGEVSWG